MMLLKMRETADLAVQADVLMKTVFLTHNQIEVYGLNFLIRRRWQEVSEEMENRRQKQTVKSKDYRQI